MPTFSRLSLVFFDKRAYSAMSSLDVNILHPHYGTILPFLGLFTYSVADAGELQPSHPQVVRLVARPPNVEGVGEITVRDLVRQALRMRPDRLVVGEVRGAEVCELLAALNTGHDGGAGTLHANSPAEVPARLEAL